MTLPRLLLLLAAPTVASATDEITSAPVAGIGGASVADPNDNGTLRSNPAAVGLSERYDLQALFRVGPLPGIYWSVNAVDARTNDYVSFGLAYDGRITRPEFLPDELPGFAPTGEEPSNRKELHDLTFALAVPFLKRRLSVGLNGTLTIFDNAWNGKGTTGNLDLGIAARPIDQLSFGLSARDILPVADQFDRPATLAFGARGGMDDLFIGAVEVDHRFEHVLGNPWNVRAGVEGVLKVVKLRAGWNWDGDVDIHRVSWGIGAFSKAGSVDYAMQIPVNDSNLAFADVIHTLSLTVKTKAFQREEPEESPVRWEDGS
jgi:hypothetical protein